MRLSPYHPHWYLGTLASAYITLGDYEAALQTARQQLDLVEKRKVFGTGLIMSHLILAEVYMHLGRGDDARKHAGEILQLAPGFSLEEFGKSTFYKDPALLEDRLEVLRQAGLK